MATDQTPELHPDQELLDVILERVRTFLARNGLHILIVVAVIAAGFMLLRIHRLRTRTRTVQDWEALSLLPDATTLALYPVEARGEAIAQGVAIVETILARGDENTATPYVKLQLAAYRASAGRWEEAAALYRRIAQDYAGTPARALARPALAACLEASGDYAAAADLYEELAADDRPDLMAEAGRCRELAGSLDAARNAYERALAAEDTETLALARSRLRALNAERPLGMPPAPPEPEAVPDAPVDSPVAETAD